MPAPTSDVSVESFVYPRPTPRRAQRPQLPVGHSFHHHDPSVLHALYDNHSTRNHHQPPTLSHSVFTYLASPLHHHQNPPNWFVPPPQIPTPPEIIHKVWILDCKSCGTFLTNRGMKVSSLFFCPFTNDDLKIFWQLGGFATPTQCPSFLH